MAIRIKVEKMESKAIPVEAEEAKEEKAEQPKEENKEEAKEPKHEKSAEDIDELKDDLKEELVKNPDLLKRTLRCLDDYAKMLESKEDNPEPEIKSIDDIKKIAYS